MPTSRKFIYLGRFSFERYLNLGSHTKFNARMSDVKSRFVAGTTSTKIQVSDVCRINGLAGGSSGYDLILLNFLNAGVLTGRQALIGIARPGTGTQRPFMQADTIGNSTTCPAHFDTIRGNTPNGFYQPFIVYNETTKDPQTNTFLNTMSVTFGGAATVGNTYKETTGGRTDETQFRVEAGPLGGGAPANTYTIRMLKGRKPRATNTFTGGLTVSSIYEDQLYDMGWDNWDTHKYAVPFTAATSLTAGGGGLVDGDAVDCVGSAGTGIFRRISGNTLWLTNTSGDFTGTTRFKKASDAGKYYDVVGALTIGTSDFTNPVNSPISANTPNGATLSFAAGVSGFMPARQRLQGYVIDDTVLNNASAQHVFGFVIDEDKPFISWLSTDGKLPGFAYKAMFGENANCYLTGDTKKSLGLAFYLTNTTTVVGTETNVRCQAYSGEAATPTPIDLTLAYHTIYNMDNAPREDGGGTIFNWDNVVLYNTTEQKGYIDNEVVRVAGAVGNHQGLSVSGGDGPFFKMHTALLWPWVSSEPLVFSPRWHQEPDDSIA